MDENGSKDMKIKNSALWVTKYNNDVWLGSQESYFLVPLAWNPPNIFIKEIEYSTYNKHITNISLK